MIDWQRCMLNIRSAGMAVTRASEQCGMDPATGMRIARGDGKEPRFSQGMKLLDLHLALCPDKHGELKQ
jgi:hypothetical protein